MQQCQTSSVINSLKLDRTILGYSSSGGCSSSSCRLPDKFCRVKICLLCILAFCPLHIQIWMAWINSNGSQPFLSPKFATMYATARDPYLLLYTSFALNCTLLCFFYVDKCLAIENSWFFFCPKSPVGFIHSLDEYFVL